MTLENIVYACYEEHKKHTSNWQHGKPQKAYYKNRGLSRPAFVILSNLPEAKKLPK